MAVPTGDNIDALSFQLDDKYLEQFNPLEVDQSNIKNKYRKHTSTIAKNGTYWNSEAGSQIRFEITRNDGDVLNLDKCNLVVSSQAKQADGTDMVVDINGVNALGALNFASGTLLINNYNIETHQTDFEKIIYENIKDEYTIVELENGALDIIARPVLTWFGSEGTGHTVSRTAEHDDVTSGAGDLSLATNARVAEHYSTASTNNYQHIPLSMLFRSLKGVDSSYIDKLEVELTVYAHDNVKYTVDDLSLTTTKTNVDITDIYIETEVTEVSKVEGDLLKSKRASGLPTYIKCLKPEILTRQFTSGSPIEITNQKNVQRAALFFDDPHIAPTTYGNNLHYSRNGITSFQVRYGNIDIPTDRPLTLPADYTELYRLFKESDIGIKEKTIASVPFDIYEVINHVYRVKFVDDIERPKLFDSNSVIFDTVGATASGILCYIILDKLEVYKINADGQVIALIR